MLQLLLLESTLRQTEQHDQPEYFINVDLPRYFGLQLGHDFFWILRVDDELLEHEALLGCLVLIELLHSIAEIVVLINQRFHLWNVHFSYLRHIFCEFLQ